ncbi:MAG: hypothetical protein AB7E79_12810 [Rhodospirillaceae bacterium]
METRPHALIERFVGALFPPLTREAVLGDLSERYRGPGQFLREAVAALPFVMAGQIRRTAIVPALALQALILFGCMGGFGDRTLPVRDVPLWLGSIPPTVLALLTLVLRDAYRRADGWSAGRALRDIIAVSAAVAFAQIAAMALAGAGLASPQWVFSVQRVVVIAIASLPSLFVIRLGLGLEGDSRLQDTIPDISALELRSDYARFRVRTRTRNLMEAGIYLFGAALGALFLLFAPGLKSQALGWIWAGGQVIVSWYLLTRASAPAMPEHGVFAHLVAFYRREIDRQRRLVRVIWWWYLWPLVIGVGMPSIARSAESPIFGVLGTAYIALAVGLVAWFSERRAHDFKEEMDILDTVQERA